MSNKRLKNFKFHGKEKTSAFVLRMREQFLISGFLYGKM